MRWERKQIHLSHGRIEANFENLAASSVGLSGGDILNISINAIHAGSADADAAKWQITQGMLEAEIARVKEAKREHGGKNGASRRVIGFQAR